MPGIPTHFKVLELTLERLKNSNDPKLVAMYELMDKDENRAFAYLGAMGPTLTDFMPADKTNPYMEIWQTIFLFLSGDGQSDPGFYPLRKRFTDYLDQVTADVAAQDLDALKALDSETQYFKNDFQNDLAKVLDKTKLDKMEGDIAKLILSDCKPSVMKPLIGPAPAPDKWQPREFLFWKKTGHFARELVKLAMDSGNDKFKAYAYGYFIGFAGKVCGSPFINSIVWAPYRLHWWRHRWINNWVDTWVYGKYESGATMHKDTPSIPYDQWPKLCDAELQKDLEIPGVTMDPLAMMEAIRDGKPLPSVIDKDFADLWFKAFDQVYGSSPTPSGITAQVVNDAYLVTWLVLWFQTSNEVLGCNPPPSQLAPPSNCDQPSWVDTSAPPGSSTTGNAPPAPDQSSYTKTNTAQEVTGILLAIFGGIAALFGYVGAGGAAVAGGIWLATHAGEVDWDKLACDIYWWRWYIYDLMEGVVKGFAKSGLTYPDPYFLGCPLDEQAYDPANGTKVVKSRITGGDFPYPAIWVPIGLPPYGGVVDFTADPRNYPSVKDKNGNTPYQMLVEKLKFNNQTVDTIGYRDSAYPDFFIDDKNNPLGNAGVRVGGTWPVRGGFTNPVQFGNAVENALDLLANLGTDLPDWILDGDRGLAYFTWEFKSHPHASPIEIEPEP